MTSLCETSGCSPTAVPMMDMSTIVIHSCTDGAQCIKMDDVYANSPAPISQDTPESSQLEVARKLCAEALGTCVLVIVIVGSGIMAETLSPNDVGLQLLENAFSVGLALIGLILMFGSVSGAHFNPVVSLVDYLHGDMGARDLILYTVSQVAGGILGALFSNLQYDVNIEISNKERHLHHLWFGEVIATVTLLLVIHGCVRTGQKSAVPVAVGAWVASGHFFTSSTIFANPAVTIARMFSDTFTGIDPGSVGQFIAFQYLGAFVGFAMIRFFFPHNLSMRKDDNLYMRVCIKGAEQC
jgi:glycerol uptake facilitator-like aquaporin